MAAPGTFLHLVQGASASDHVREALRLLGRAEDVIGLVDGLAEGPLNDVDAGGASRVAWWSRGPGRKPSARELRTLDERAVWTRVRADVRNVVCWYGPHASEWLSAMRACWHLRDQPSRVH